MRKTLEKKKGHCLSWGGPAPRAVVRFLTPALIAFIALFSSCSTEQGRDLTVEKVLGRMSGEPVVPRSANRIQVPEFDNLTPVHSLSARISIRVREEIASDGRLGIASGGEQADLLLEGKITSYQTQALEFNGAGLPVKKRMRMLAAVRLIDIVSNREIFSDRDIQAFETYSEIAPPVSTEQTVQDRVLTELARRVAKQAVTGWYTGLMTREEKGKR
jgi:hypothetical protein